MTLPMTLPMAPPVSTAKAPSGQTSLEQERSRWFTTLQGLTDHFQAERESLASKLRREQLGACRDLDEDARLTENLTLPAQARDLVNKYVAEIRTRRLNECQHDYDAAVKKLEQHEKDHLRQHHQSFPLPNTFLGRTVAKLPPPHPSTVPSQAAQQAMPPPQTKPASNYVRNNQLSSNANSAPMPPQPPSHRQWPSYAQPGLRHGSPPLSASPYQQKLSNHHIHQGQPLNRSVNPHPRMLPSNGIAPILGSNMAGSNTGPPVRRGSSSAAGSPPLPDSSTDDCGARVPIPPIVNHAVSTPHGACIPTTRPPLEQSAWQVKEQQLENLRQKRKSDAGESSYQDVNAKRARIGSPKTTAPRTITFQEVYQDGKAAFKHTIVKFEGVFYILRCDEHGVHFKQNAIAAGAKHLHGASHGNLKKEHRLAVEMFGFRVVDCTDDLAKLNNAVVAQAFENGYKPLNQLHGPKSGGKRLSGVPVSSGSLELDKPSQVYKQPQLKQQAPAHYITNPEAGDLYHASWPKGIGTYVVMVLGWTHLTMCGWVETFPDLPLYEEKQRPPCYVFNKEGIAGWAEGYGDGEPRVLEREVPVMWFETNGKNRLGWLNVKMLSPFLLDDPNRPADPSHTSNRARNFYADVRGYNSFDDMLAGVKKINASSADAQNPTDPDPPTQLPSSASASDSASDQDVDMYDFGDNPPRVDDSDDDDYVETKRRRGRDSDDEMDDGEPTASRPTRRSAQVARSSSQLDDDDGGWRSARTGTATAAVAADETRPSAKQDTDSREQVATDGAAHATPTTSRVSAAREGGGGKEITTAPGGTGHAASSNSEASTRAAAPGTFATSAQRTGAENKAAATARDSQRTAEAAASAAAANSANKQGERSVASKWSPSLATDNTPRVSPKLQVANLLNESGPEKPEEVPPINSHDGGDHACGADKSVEARRPSPSHPGQPYINDSAPTQSVSLGHDQQRVAPQSKPCESKAQAATSVANGNIQASAIGGKETGEGGNATTRRADAETEEDGRSEAVAHGPDQRMSISSAVDEGGLSDQQLSQQTAAATVIVAAATVTPTTTNGSTMSGGSTPKVLTQVGLANDERWRAVRTSTSSESPRMPPNDARPPSIDRTATGSQEAEPVCIHVASFSEGGKSWARGDEFLPFYTEDEARGIARTKAADGIEATVDARQVKAAQVDYAKSMVRLVLETAEGKSLEQQFVFERNYLTGSYRGARPQCTKFYHWVTSKNPAIEHIA